MNFINKFKNIFSKVIQIEESTVFTVFAILSFIIEVVKAT